MFCPSRDIPKIIQRIPDKNSIDLDEVAHYEPPHLDLHCLLANSAIAGSVNSLFDESSLYSMGHFKQ